MFGSCLGVVLCACVSLCVCVCVRKIIIIRPKKHTQQQDKVGSILFGVASVCVRAKVSWVSIGAVSKRSARFPEPLLRRKHVLIAHPLRFMTPLVPHFEKYTPWKSRNIPVKANTILKQMEVADQDGLVCALTARKVLQESPRAQSFQPTS